MYTIDLHWIEKDYSNRSLDDLCAGLRELVADNGHAEAFCAVAYWCAAHAPEGFDADRRYERAKVYRAFAQVIASLDGLNQVFGYNRTSGKDYVTISGDIRLDLLHVKVAADYYGSSIYERICEAL
jgi:hypothetical protein